MSNYSLFINTLLSNKELKINSNNTLKITESSVFKNTKTIIPIDLIETQAKKGSRLDYQWIIFGLVSFMAASLFTLLALTQQFTSVLILGAIFTIIGISSVFLAFKFKTVTHTYQYKGTSMTLFTLTENDFNESQIADFVNNLKSNENNDIDNSEGLLNSQVDEFYGHLDFLYEEKIIDNRLMLKLQQKAHNKVYGDNSKHLSEDTNNTQTQDNVIAFPITGTK